MEFLKALEAALPPPERCHHCMMYAQYGSDETGWSDRLMLQVNKVGKFYPFFLDDNDFAEGDAALISEIKGLLASGDEKFQISDTPGQAGKVGA
jgi:hypothetical protein